MRRSFIILSAAICGHVLLFWAVRHFVIFRAEQPSEDGSAGDFLRVAVTLVKPKTPESSDDSKVAPPVIPPLNMVQVPASTIRPSIVFSPSITPTFNIPVTKVQIPSLSDAMMHGMGGPGGGRQGLGQGINGGGSSQSANLFGMDVSSDGPIIAFLDTSESLKSQHDAVAAEITKLLPSCSIVDINGVVFSTRATLEHLKANATLSEYFADYYLTLVDGSIIPRITDQIKSHQLTGPMTIYYFSDFEDYADRKDVEAFSQLLQDNHIRFYAYSVEKEPDDAIKSMCTDTGGAWKVKSADSP